MNKDIKFIIAAGIIHRVTLWGASTAKTNVLGIPLYDTWDEAYSYLLFTATIDYAVARQTLLGVLC